jgi:hypothetical protein
VDGLFEGLLDALPGLVKHPAVVHAPQAFFFRDTVAHVDAAVGAEGVYQAECAFAVLVENEVFSKQAHGLGGPVVEFGSGGDGVPVAAHELAHRGALPYSD